MSVGFIRTEDSCIQFKMAAASLMRGFSRWEFVVLGRKTQAFNNINQKNNFWGTLGCLKDEISEFIEKKFLFEIVVVFWHLSIIHARGQKGTPTPLVVVASMESMNHRWILNFDGFTWTVQNTTIVSRRNMCDRKQDLQIITWAIDVLGNFCVLLRINLQNTTGLNVTASALC